jgi:hypothetical protein
MLLSFILGVLLVLGWTAYITVSGLLFKQRYHCKWAAEAQKAALDIDDLPELRQAASMGGLLAPYGTGSLVFVRNKTRAGMLQNIAMNSLSSHVALLVWLPQFPSVPFLYEAVDTLGCQFRPLYEYVTASKSDVWIRSFRGSSAEEQRLFDAMAASPRLGYSYAFDVTMVERMLPILPIQWPFRLGGLVFCSELVIRVIAAAGLLRSDVRLEHWLPADFEPHRRMDRHLPNRWGPPVRLMARRRSPEQHVGDMMAAT